MECTGKVVNGVVVLDSTSNVPEGARVRISVLAETREGTTLGQRLLKHSGLAEGLPEDMAENHDHYLHGRPKK